MHMPKYAGTKTCLIFYLVGEICGKKVANGVKDIEY